jgi:hypothetical protein
MRMAMVAADVSMFPMNADAQIVKLPLKQTANLRLKTDTLFFLLMDTKNA